ncbi:hypothetical protein niasHT_002740 [Heterodera trifolii]|uniref:C6 domain-containing protein n=1 Tax=Heterodera trifolii TaxID=157864 RepID=A0ABD2MA30_9BILA
MDSIDGTDFVGNPTLEITLALTLALNHRFQLEQSAQHGDGTLRNQCPLKAAVGHPLTPWRARRTVRTDWRAPPGTATTPRAPTRGRRVSTLTTASTAATTAGAGTAGCTTCSSTSLRLLSPAEAVASGLLQATATTMPTNNVGTNGAGCTTLTPTCGASQVVSIHVILANGDTDFGNYDSGAITFECNSNGQWAVPAGAEHPGDVVDGYSCVTSATG